MKIIHTLTALVFGAYKEEDMNHVIPAYSINYPNKAPDSFLEWRKYIHASY
jgi:hypothetical protein